MLLGYGSRLTKVFLAYATTSPDRVASHSKDPLWFPNTCCLMASPAGHSKSQWLRSCQRGGISGRLDLEMVWDGEDTDGEKDGGQIVNEQAVRQLFSSWFVLSHVKPLGVGKLVKSICV